MKYIIITGTSKGVGESIAKALLNENNHLFCISRGVNNDLISEAKEKGVKLQYIQQDLNKVEEIESLMEGIFKNIDTDNIDGVYLINNAGIVAPIKKVEGLKWEDVSLNLNVNLAAPMLITSNFIKCAKELRIEKRIINVSSGAGKNPIFGWSAYCTAKAGVDLFTRCVALEQENQEYPAKVISFGPGIVDTNMQKEIRSSDKENFVDLDKFIGFKEQGNLRQPEEVAEAVTELLFRESFENGKVTSIAEYLSNSK